MTTPEKTELQNLIAKGDTQAAVQSLMEKRATFNPDTKNEIVQLSARWVEYQRKARLGLFALGESGPILHNINHDLLQFIQQIDQPKVEQLKTEEKPKAKTRNILIGISTGIALLAGLAEITGINLLHFFPSKTSTDTENLRDSIPTTQPDVKVVDTTTTREMPITPQEKKPATPPPSQVTTNETTKPKTTPPKGPLKISCKTNKGNQQLTFRKGESMHLYYQVNQACHLRIIYQLADGRIILFDEDQQVRTAQVGQDIELGQGFEVDAPYGEETLYLFAQTQAFAALQTERSEDGYILIKDGLPEALQKTRGFKKKNYFAETKLAITTLE